MYDWVMIFLMKRFLFRFNLSKWCIGCTPFATQNSTYRKEVRLLVYQGHATKPGLHTSSCCTVWREHSKIEWPITYIGLELFICENICIHLYIKKHAKVKIFPDSETIVEEIMGNPPLYEQLVPVIPTLLNLIKYPMRKRISDLRKLKTSAFLNIK